MPEQIRWFDAQFTDGSRRYTVGPFDTADEATVYGTQNDSPELRFAGVAARVGRQELAKVAAQARLARQGAPASAGKRSGAVTRWDQGATHGFITDTDGTSWFVSRDSLPEGRTLLPVGARVSFAGSPKPAPGKRYPQAYSVEVR